MRWVGALLVFASCYDVPKPVCGFRCGPSAACPADYTCAEDGFCHAVGSSQSQTCPLVDAGIDAFDFWPFIQALSPLDDAMSVATETDVSVKFTEQVLGISATTFTLAVEGETTPVPATVTYDFPTRTATLDPDGPLRSSKRYVAALGDGIEDARGNPIYGKRTWAFKTAHDTMRPTVTIDPPHGATNVPVDSIVLMTFSEQVQYPNGGIGISPGGFSFGFASVTALKFTPIGAMLPFTTYTVTITDAVTDLTGNPLANAPVISSFTTGPDTIAPTVVSTIPVADESSVPLPITFVSAQFSEPVTGVSSSTFTLHDGATQIPATVQYLVSNNRARLAPSAPLSANTIYTARLTTGIEDAVGNVLAPVTWSFTTEP